MAGKLKSELKQTKEFTRIEEEANLNIIRTAEFLMAAMAEVMKQESLTLTQYNALRILRGAGEKGLMCVEIGERMVTKESDITRLLDRLETRGLVSRERPADNRRVVITRITAEGSKLLSRLDQPVANANVKLSGRLSKTQLTSLIEILETIREN